MPSDQFTALVQAHIADLSPIMRRVAQYFDQNRVEVLSRSANDLAKALTTSDASIVRTAQALGYAGLADLKRSLADLMAEAAPVDAFLQTLDSANADARRAVVQFVALLRHQTEEEFDDKALANLQSMAARLDIARRIVLFGIGPTSHLAGYGAHLLRRHGRSVLLLDAAGNALADQLLELQSGDAVLAFSYGQPYAEVQAVTMEAKALSLPMLLVTDRPDSRLARQADMVARVPRGEAHGMALHSCTLIWLEGLIVSLSVLGSARTASGLERLGRLRKQVANRDNT